MSANDEDVQHSEEPRPEEEPPAPDVLEWDPVTAFGEFPADAETETVIEAEAASEAAPVEAVAEPAFEMPPPDFALEFESADVLETGDAGDAVVGEVAAPSFDSGVPELPTDLPEWDPAAEFSPESFDEPESAPVAAPSPVVTETNVFTSVSPDPSDFSGIPEPVFEPEAFAEEPAVAEMVAPAPEAVAPAAPAGDSAGLERVLATIDAEVAVTERRPVAPAGAASTVAGTAFVGFVHGDGRFAFSIEGITEITRSVRTTPVPFTPEWVVGVTNLRGDILAVADFGLMLGRGAVSSRDGAYMIVLQGKRTAFSLGLLVDAVTGMRTFGEGDILTPTAPLGDRVTQFARGVTGTGAELTVVLDVEAFLALPEMQQFSQN